MSLGQWLIDIDVGLSSLGSKLGQARTQIVKFGNDASAAILKNEQAFQSAGIAIAGFGAAITGALAVAVKFGSDFDQSMAKVRAVTQATGKDFTDLREMAIQLGIDTEFSAKQAADGIAILGRAGFETTEIMDALPGVLDLAAAGELALADAADIAASSLGGFNEESSEAARLADILAAAASSANTTVANMGQAFVFAAPIAGTLGIEMEEVAAAIGLLGDAGIQATMAGTGLRRMLTSLLNPSKENKELMQELGLSATNLDGSYKSLTEIVSDLEDANISAGDAFKIFGERGGNIATILKNTGSPALQQFTRDLENSEGEARRMAETLLDSLAGSFRLLGSSIETFMIALSGTGQTGLQGGLRRVVDTVIEVINAMTQWMTQNPELTRIIVVTVGVIGTMATALGAVLLIIPKLAAAWVAFATLLGTSTALTGPIGIALAAITAIGVAIGLWLTRTDEMIDASAQGAIAMDRQAKELSNLLLRYDELNEKTALTKEEQKELASITKTLSREVGVEATTFNDAGEAVAVNTKAVKALILEKQELRDAMLAELNRQEAETEERLVEVREQRAQVTADLTKAEADLVTAQAAVNKGLGGGFDAVKLYEGKVKTLKNEHTGLTNEMLELNKTLDDTRAEIDVVTEKGDEFSRVLQQLQENAEDLADTADMGVAPTLRELAVKTLPNTTDMVGQLDRKIEELGEDAPRKLKLVGSAAEDMRDEVVEAAEAIQRSMSAKFVDGFLDAYVEIVSKWGDTTQQLEDLGAGTARALGDFFKEGFISVLKLDLDGLLDAFKNFFGRVFDMFINMVAEMLAARAFTALLNAMSSIFGGGGGGGGGAGSVAQTVVEAGASAGTTAAIGALTGGGAAAAAGAGGGAAAAGATTAAAGGGATAAGGGGAAAAGAGALGGLAAGAGGLVFGALLDAFLPSGISLEERIAAGKLRNQDFMKQRTIQAEGVVSGTLNVLRKMFEGGQLTMALANDQINNMTSQFEQLPFSVAGFTLWKPFGTFAEWVTDLRSKIAMSLAEGELMFRRGGVVTSPFRGMVSMAEDEPEIVAPLSRLGEVVDQLASAGGGAGTTVNLTIQTLDIDRNAPDIIRFVREDLMPIIRDETHDGTPLAFEQGIEEDL